jgi:hypothetical protein
MNIARKPGDILRACMHKRRTRVLFPIVFVCLVAALALANSATSPGFLRTSRAIAAAPHQGATPTPEVAGHSVPGSTDALLWTTMAIVVIVLLPVVTRRSLWR